jgi:hypothetical protein
LPEKNGREPDTGVRLSPHGTGRAGSADPARRTEQPSVALFVFSAVFVKKLKKLKTEINDKHFN